MLLLLGACKLPAKDAGTNRYDHITQDRVDVDLDTGAFQFNDDPVSPEQLETDLKKSYSVDLYASPYSETQETVAADHLLSLLEMMDQAGLDSKRVRMNLYMEPV
jgi:hypothetical protein